MGRPTFQKRKCRGKNRNGRFGGGEPCLSIVLLCRLLPLSFPFPSLSRRFLYGSRQARPHPQRRNRTSFATCPIAEERMSSWHRKYNVSFGGF